MNVQCMYYIRTDNRHGFVSSCSSTDTCSHAWCCLFLLHHRHMQPCMVLSLLAPPQTHATMHGVASSCSSTDTCSHAWCCLFLLTTGTCSHAWCCLFLLQHRHVQPCMVLSLLAPPQTHATMHGVVSSCSNTDTCSHAWRCLFLLHHRHMQPCTVLSLSCSTTDYGSLTLYSKL